VRLVVWLALCLADATAVAEGEAAGRNDLDARVQAAIAEFATRVPERYFADAWGYAVLPSVKRAGYGLGAAWGRGLLFENGAPGGEVRFWQVTSGIQIGARATSMIVFVRDADAMRELRANRVQFMGQAGLTPFVGGPAKSPAYDSGVAVFVLNRMGVMAEASIAVGRLAVRQASR
jgi:lipid-binding SYLF domain-containing protein